MPSSTISCSRGPTARRPTTSAWSSTTSTCGSRTSSAATTTSTTRRGRSTSSGRWAHEPPVYAHVPTVLGEDGQKLSKRHGAISVMQYEEQGYLPDAMVNFLARLGWGHGDDEVFARDSIRRVVRPRRDQPRAVAVQRRKAEVAEPGAHEAPARGRARTPARAVPGARRARSGGRAGARCRGRAGAGPRGDARRDGRRRALLLRDAGAVAGAAGGARQCRESARADGSRRGVRHCGMDARRRSAPR